jgi:hypothetical protein
MKKLFRLYRGRAGSGAVVFAGTKVGAPDGRRKKNRFYF